MTHLVTVISRAECHLCEVALEVVRRVCAETGTALEVVDVDADIDLRRRYGDQVPVIMVDGAQHDFWRVDEHRLRAALR